MEAGTVKRKSCSRVAVIALPGVNVYVLLKRGKR